MLHRRLEAARKQLWCFMRVEVLALLIGIGLALFSSFMSCLFVQNIVFLFNSWLIVDFFTIKKFKTIVIGLGVAGIFGMMLSGSSYYKFNMMGSMISENYIGMPVYLGLIRVNPFVGSDYVTFNILDVVVPALTYKFMTMVDMKRDDWVRRNRLQLESDHPNYGAVTGRVIILCSVLSLLWMGATIDSTQFFSLFIVIEGLTWLIVGWWNKDITQFRTFAKDLSQEIPNIGEENLMEPFQAPENH